MAKTTRESVLRALTTRRFGKTGRIIGASRFGWYGPRAWITEVIGPGTDPVRFRNWSEVESCVASMIADRPSVARVL